jgi:hypothetical protein
MLVVVASRYDQGAREIVARWAPQGAMILTCEDVSSGGWRYDVTAPEDSLAVIGGQKIPCSEITGVLTRRPCILEEELLHITPGDRRYVAAEMNAFLIAWLSSLSCPMFNRPTASSLSGPNWRREQWIHAAARQGIPVRPGYRWVPFERDEHPAISKENVSEVTIVGERSFGEVDEVVVAQAKRLAAAAGVNLLSVAFDGSQAGASFIGANPIPPITSGVADAICEYVQSHSPMSLVKQR